MNTTNSKASDTYRLKLTKADLDDVILALNARIHTIEVNADDAECAGVDSDRVAARRAHADRLRKLATKIALTAR